MSRVERIDRNERSSDEERRTAELPRSAERTPSKAEGEERDVDEALRNQEPRGARE